VGNPLITTPNIQPASKPPTWAPLAMAPAPINSMLPTIPIKSQIIIKANMAMGGGAIQPGLRHWVAMINPMNAYTTPDIPPNIDGPSHQYWL
jgi:hypothetical protein